MPPQDEINLSSLAQHNGFSWYSSYLRTFLQSPPFPVSSIWSIILPHGSSHSQYCLVPVPLHLLIPFPGTPLCPTLPYSSYTAQSRNPFREAFQGPSHWSGWASSVLPLASYVIIGNSSMLHVTCGFTGLLFPGVYNSLEKGTVSLSSNSWCLMQSLSHREYPTNVVEWMWVIYFIWWKNNELCVLAFESSLVFCLCLASEAQPVLTFARVLCVRTSDHPSRCWSSGLNYNFSFTHPWF